MPPEKAYTLENSAKLWLIYIILLTATPIALIFFLSTKGLEYTSYLNQFKVWRSNYGLLAGFVYIIPWFLHYSLFLIPPLAAILFYFFSPSIFKKYEKLVPAGENNNITSSYKEPISLFQEALIKVVNEASLPSTPKVYIKKEIKPNCFVFGKNRSNFLIVVTLGLLESIKEGTIKAEELEAIISHEVGHVLNSDLRLASSIKIFSAFKIPKFVILGVFAAFLLIYLSGLGLNLYYNQNLSMAERLGKSYEYLKGFYPLIPFFPILYLSYAAVEILIRTTFKAREFFADTQAILTFKSESVFIRALAEISSGLSLLVPDSHGLGLLPSIKVISWPLSFTRFLFRIFFFLSEGFQEKTTEKIKKITKRLEAVYLTHPSTDKRIEAIANRTYFAMLPAHISYKAYLTVGITLLISFLFLVSLASQLEAFSFWSLLLYFFYALLALVFINNSHLRHLPKYNLIALKDGFMLCGFVTRHALMRDYGRKLFFANHLAHLPLAIFPLSVFIIGDFPLVIFVIMLILQFSIIHLCTSFFLTLLSWSKKG
jgi:Zn-dependent protease with chaperone function